MRRTLRIGRFAASAFATLAVTPARHARTRAHDPEAAHDHIRLATIGDPVLDPVSAEPGDPSDSSFARRPSFATAATALPALLCSLGLAFAEPAQAQSSPITGAACTASGGNFISYSSYNYARTEDCLQGSGAQVSYCTYKDGAHPLGDTGPSASTGCTIKIPSSLDTTGDGALLHVSQNCSDMNPGDTSEIASLETCEVELAAECEAWERRVLSVSDVTTANAFAPCRDVNVAPAFSSDDDTREIEENSAGGTNVGAAVTATDLNTGDTLTYSLSGTDAGFFEIGETTGQITVGADTSLDFESMKKSYSVTVEVKDSKDGDGARTWPSTTRSRSPSTSPTRTSRRTSRTRRWCRRRRARTRAWT